MSFVTMLALAGASLVTHAGATDGTQPGVSVGDASVLEGSGGSEATVTVPLTLSFASASTVTVDWTTVDGTAGETDYDGKSGTVTFVPGDVLEAVDVQIDGGDNPEWNEYFTIFLRNPVNAVIDRAIGKVTIINDDGQPLGVEPGEINVTPVEGTGQCIKLDNGAGCQPLQQGQLVDLDDVLYINPGSGRVEVRSAAGAVAFYGGRFAVEEANLGAKPVAVIKLVGGSFKQCTTGNRSLAAKGKPVRRLWGKGKGRYRTRGRYSSGTVRGTSWLTEDYCDGTRTRVFGGVVRIFDLVTKKTIVLKAGQSYFANAGKIK